MKKLLELIKKLLGMSGSSDSASSSESSEKGFTLIELLIVIAILGVLAAGVLVAIDPVDRIKSANDSQVQKDVASIANASEAYAATHDGLYPTGTNLLVSNGDLKVIPTAPAASYTYTYSSPAGNTSFTMTGTLRSKKYTGYALFRYDSATGKACPWSGTACQP